MRLLPIAFLLAAASSANAAGWTDRAEAAPQKKFASLDHLAQQVPARLQLPVGKYEIREVKEGQILGTQSIEVTSQGISAVTVKR